jgi:hypothetical protein
MTATLKTVSCSKSKYFIGKHFFLIFTLIYFAVYLKSVFFGFVEDDYGLIALDYKSAINETFHTHHFRPIMFLSYPLVNELFGKTAFAHHLVNFLIQYVNSLLALIIFSKWVGKIKIFFIVTIWNLLPWSVFPIVWISQRNDLLMTFFVFTSIYLMEKKSVLLASFSSLLAFLSKVTSLFFPIYMVLFYKKSKNFIYGGLITFLISLLCAWWGFRQYLIKPHLADLSFNLRMLNYCKNWVHGWISIVMPIPFFVNYLHFVIYGFFLVFFTLWARKYYLFTETSKKGVALALLLSITTAMNPELRVVFLQSFFFLLFVIASLKNPVLNKMFFIIALLFTAYILPANLLTQNKFDSAEYTGEMENAYKPSSSALYLNSYYPNLRQFFINAKSYL